MYNYRKCENVKLSKHMPILPLTMKIYNINKNVVYKY